MQLVVLVIHLIVCICLVGLVLLQRSEGGALGMGGGSGSLVSGRGAADALAKMTSVAGVFFLITSLSLTVLSGAAANASSRSVFDLIPRQERIAPVTPAQPAPAQPTTPDPTESSAPQAAETQVASLTTPPAAAATAAPVSSSPAAPAITQSATRAGPLESRPQQTAARAPASSPQTAAATPRQAAATPTQTPARQTTTPSRQNTTPASTTQTTRSGTSPTRPLVLPNTSGGSTGLTTPAPSGAESVEVVNGVEAVRRERAGPDQ